MPKSKPSNVESRSNLNRFHISSIWRHGEMIPPKSRELRCISKLLILPIISIFTIAVVAQDCPNPPSTTKANPNEAEAAAAFTNALVLSAGCGSPTKKDSCKATSDAFVKLETAALKISGIDAVCAAAGRNSAGDLSDTEKAWYLRRSAFWRDVYESIKVQDSDVVAGKSVYKLSDDQRAGFVDVKTSLPPVIVAAPVSGASTVSVRLFASQYPSQTVPTSIYLCVFDKKPESSSLDCTGPKSAVKPAPLVGDKVDPDTKDHLVVSQAGTYAIGVKSPFQNSQFVSVVQRFPIDGGENTITSTTSVAVSQTNQCNNDTRSTPYSDCDMATTIIGGIEQSAQSSLPSSTTPFLRIFTRAGPDKHKQDQLWGLVRVLGSPQASSTNGVVSAVTDPAGNITTQSFSGIGTSIDFEVGLEYVLTKPGVKDYSVSMIAGYGGTTPLTANTLNQAYKAPAFGTVECSTLLSRFATQFSADRIIAGTSSNAATPACLVNANSVTSATGATTTTFTPVTIIGFANQDRTSFLGKDFVGFRTIDRFTTNGNLYCGTQDADKHIGPCERGIVDFLFGQDATVTGGQMRHFVFKVDAIHPFPVKSVSFLYLFGSASVRLSRNTNYAPLVLQSGDVASLSGTGANAAPNAGVVILPLTQPNRDFYRFGAGINVNTVFKKLFSAPSTNAGQ